MSQNGDGDDADVEDGVDDEGRRDEADEKLQREGGDHSSLRARSKEVPFIILCLGKAVLENTSFMSF